MVGGMNEAGTGGTPKVTTSDTETGNFISRFLSQVIGDKRRWRQYKARVKQLPPDYRAAVDGIERYLMHFGPTDGESATSLFEEVADLFERAAADGAPIRRIVGNDPVEFVDALIRNHEKGGYVARERERLIGAIDRAAGKENGGTR